MLRQIYHFRLIFTVMLASGLITLTANASLLQQTTVKAKQITIKDISATYMIGVVSRPVSETLRLQLPQLKGQGLDVRYIGSKTPAEQAGVQLHDILLKANRQTLKTTSDLQKVVEQAGKEKKKVTLELLRSGTQQQVQVNVIKSQSSPIQPIQVADDILHIWKEGEKLKPINSKIMTIISKDNKGTEVRLTTAGNAKPVAIVISKKGKIVLDLSDVKISKLPADIKERIQKMVQEHEKQKRTGKALVVYPDQKLTGSTIINKKLGNVGVPVHFHKPGQDVGFPTYIYKPPSMEYRVAGPVRKTEKQQIDGYEITLVVDGKKPISITLKKAENKWKTNTWTCTEKEIDQLPAEVKKTAKNALKKYHVRQQAKSEAKSAWDSAIVGWESMEMVMPKGTPHKNTLRGMRMPSFHQHGSQPNKQLTEMNKQIKALTAAIEKLNKKLDNK